MDHRFRHLHLLVPLDEIGLAVDSDGHGAFLVLPAPGRDDDPHLALPAKLRRRLRLALLDGLVQAFALLRGQGRLAAGFLFLRHFLFLHLGHDGSCYSEDTATSARIMCRSYRMMAPCHIFHAMLPR